MQTLKNIALIISLTLFINTILLPQVTRAHGGVEVSYTKQQINPGSVLYPLKRGLEKLQEKISFSNDSKTKLHKGLLKKRVSELNYLVENKRLTPIENATQRFSSQAAAYIDTTENLDEHGKEDIKKEFEEYKKILSNLRDNFGANSGYWLLIQHNINTLDILLEKL